MAKIKEDRRNFIKFSTLGILGLTLGAGMVISPYALSAETRLRPPGAVSEKEFLALCIKCGQCLQVCPYHSIKLADMAKGHGVGTPYIDARERGCYAIGNDQITKARTSSMTCTISQASKAMQAREAFFIIIPSLSKYRYFKN